MAKKKSKKAGKGRKKPARKASRKTARKASRKPARKSARRPARKAAKKAAKKKPARKAAKRAAKKSAPKKAVRRKPAVAPKPLGEGDWKSDAKYAESLQDWGSAHDSGTLAREAEAELPGDLRESEDREVADSAARGTEKLEEPDEEW